MATTSTVQSLLLCIEHINMIKMCGKVMMRKSEDPL